MPNTTPNLGLIKPLVTENYDIAKVTNENADILDLEIKTVKDDILDKQPTLVSGTNIKTINSASILSSGDLALAPLASPTFTGTPTISGSGRVISNDTAAGTSVFEIWSGTQAQYDAIGTKDANTLYFIV